jgi:hypothetical protein
MQPEDARPFGTISSPCAVTAITSFPARFWHPESVLPVFGKIRGGCLFTLGRGMLAAPFVRPANNPLSNDISLQEPALSPFPTSVHGGQIWGTRLFR